MSFMDNYRLEQTDNLLYLKLLSNKQPGCSLSFIGCVGLIMALLPIIVTVFLIKELSFGVILSWLISWLISGYFIRLYMWNKYGEDVFIIDNAVLTAYNDYKLFKDNYRHHQFKEIDVLYLINGDFVSIDKMSEVDNNQLSKIAFKLDKEIIISHKELPIFDIIKIANQIKNRNFS